jgi:Zn-dependent protease with chaperone function
LVVWVLLIIRAIAARFKQRSIPQDSAVTECVARYSTVLGTRCPRIRFVADDRPYLEARVPWFGVRATILVSDGAMSTFSSAEIAAALAHELAHVRHDARTIRMTRWASLLAMFPCNVFAILLDTESREMRADRIAVDLTGWRDPLVGAIVRASLGWIFGRTGKQPVVRPARQEATRWWQRRWQNFRRYATMLAALCQPDLILGYAHPHPEDRLRAIAGADGSESRIEAR